MQDRHTDRQNGLHDASLVSGSFWLWVVLLDSGMMGTFKTSSQGQRVGREWRVAVGAVVNSVREIGLSFKSAF